jgi:signal transduction histidine kinase
MIRRTDPLIRLINLIILVLLCAFAQGAWAESWDTAKVAEMNRRFRILYEAGNDSAFYRYAHEFEEYLKRTGDWKTYYVTKTNEGFYDIRRKNLFRAIRTAEYLDADVRRNNDVDYYYLPTSLMGNVYRVSHDSRRAEQYFVQALDEADDRDPKFTMFVQRFLAQMFCIKDPVKAIDYVNQSEQIAVKTEDTGALTLSKAIKVYVQFLNGNRADFEDTYYEYEQLRQQGDTAINQQYDRLVEIARLTFDGHYQKAIDKLREGRVGVDSLLVAAAIYGQAGDVENSIQAMRNKVFEMDSVFSDVQDAHYDQLATGRTLMRTREEAAASKSKVQRLTNWIIGICVAFLIIYVMGRRRLTRIIWDKNKKLRDALARAEESSRMKSAFINNMNHEIRTPLNAIGGFSNLLCQPGIKLSEKDMKDMRSRIGYNVELITTIVDEMLELSKSESEKNRRPDSDMEDVMINVLCQNLLRSAPLDSKKVETRFKTNVADDFTVHTHPSTVTRIMTHILDNAWKFTEKGYVELRCEYDQPARQVRLIVEDTGIGIKPEDRDRIFDVFEKAVDNYKEGIGLGLPISQRLASSIGGVITLDPEYTDGCRFILTIPAEET